MNKQYRIALISPKHFYRNFWALKDLGRTLNKKTCIYPQVLPLLAALTPDNYDITLIDEETEGFDLESAAFDLVGISALATNIERGFELAAYFRERGTPVIMGGPHPSVVPDTVLKHADTVVIGEVEDIWADILADFERGTMATIYKADKVPDISNQPMPRWDLVNLKDLMVLNIQISRGCPNNCDFCCVTRMYGGRQRFREIDNVIEEIQSLPIKQFSIVDDNFAVNREYALQLAKRLTPLKVSWNCLCDFTIAGDDELLETMADAGCHTILIGFEALQQENLGGALRKQRNISKYKEAIASTHRHGIHLIGAFIVGFEEDTLESFDTIYRFYRENKISYIMQNILTVFPGTPLYDKMAKEGRTYNSPPRYLNGIFPTIQYKNIGPMEIVNGYLDTQEKLFSYSLLEEKIQSLFTGGSFNRKRNGIQTSVALNGIRRVLQEFVFTKNREKRRIFRSIIRYSLNNKIMIPIIFEYLLFFIAANRYIGYCRHNQKEMMEKIETEILSSPL